MQLGQQAANVIIQALNSMTATNLLAPLIPTLPDIFIQHLPFQQVAAEGFITDVELNQLFELLHNDNRYRESRTRLSVDETHGAFNLDLSNGDATALIRLLPVIKKPDLTLEQRKSIKNGIQKIENFCGLTDEQRKEFSIALTYLPLGMPNNRLTREQLIYLLSAIAKNDGHQYQAVDPFPIIFLNSNDLENEVTQAIIPPGLSVAIRNEMRLGILAIPNADLSPAQHHQLNAELCKIVQNDINNNQLSAACIQRILNSMADKLGTRLQIEQNAQSLLLDPATVRQQLTIRIIPPGLTAPERRALHDGIMAVHNGFSEVNIDRLDATISCVLADEIDNNQLSKATIENVLHSSADANGTCLQVYDHELVNFTAHEITQMIIPPGLTVQQRKLIHAAITEIPNSELDEQQIRLLDAALCCVELAHLANNQLSVDSLGEILNAFANQNGTRLQRTVNAQAISLLPIETIKQNITKSIIPPGLTSRQRQAIHQGIINVAHSVLTDRQIEILDAHICKIIAINVNNNQLSCDDLQHLLTVIADLDGTHLQVKNQPPTIYLDSDHLASVITQSIIQPGITQQQRQEIHAGICDIQHVDLTERQLEALDGTICRITVEKIIANQLNSIDLQFLLDAIADKNGTHLQVVTPPMNIKLDSASLPSDIKKAIVNPSLTKQQRQDIRSGILAVPNLNPAALAAPPFEKLDAELSKLLLTDNQLKIIHLKQILSSVSCDGTHLKLKEQAATITLTIPNLATVITDNIIFPSLTFEQRVAIRRGIENIPNIATPNNLSFEQATSLDTILSTYKFANNQITHDDLKILLAALDNGIEGTCIQVKPEAPIIHIDSPDLRVDISDAIKPPNLTPTQRKLIKIGILEIPNIGDIKRYYLKALDIMLSSLEIRTANLLPQKQLLDILATLRSNGTNLQLKNKSGDGDAIVLNNGNLNKSIQAVIVSPSFSPERRIALREGVLLLSHNDQYTQAQLNELDALLSTMKPERIDQELTPKEKDSLISTVAAKSTNSTILIELGPTCCSEDYKQNCMDFWCCSWTRLFSGRAEERLTRPANNHQVGLLLSSRNDLRQKVGRLNSALVFSGIILGAVITLLEAIRQKGIEGKGMDYSLLVIPIAIGLLTALCKYIHEKTVNSIHANTASLVQLDITPTPINGVLPQIPAVVPVVPSPAAAPAVPAIAAPRR